MDPAYRDPGRRLGNEIPFLAWSPLGARRGRRFLSDLRSAPREPVKADLAPATLRDAESSLPLLLGRGPTQVCDDAGGAVARRRPGSRDPKEATVDGDIVIRGGSLIDGTRRPRPAGRRGGGRRAHRRRRARACGASASSTPRARSWPPGSSTSTPTTTPRCSGTRGSRRRRSTA